MTVSTQITAALRALETLKGLRSLPNQQEAEDLRGWTGWGPLAPAFAARPEGRWAAVADTIEDLFSDDPKGLIAAQKHLDTSFFTPPALIDAAFSVLRRAGFTGGSIFEPGCGSGRFMSASPADMDIQWTGVEIDPTSAAIAAVLHPGAEIINEPLQKTAFKAGRFDAAIGNVPFSSTQVFDPEFPGMNLHDYFLARSLDAVRDGGYVVLITSRFTIDTGNSLGGVRRISDLIGAVRLPSGTFREDGTEVVTDMLVLRRNDSGNTSGWKELKAPHIEGGLKLPYRASVKTPLNPASYALPVEVSWYWHNCPESVAGVMRATGNRHNALAVVTEDIPGSITRAVESLLPKVKPMSARPVIGGQDLSDVPLTDAEGRKEGSFHILDGDVHQVQLGTLTPMPKAGKELRALIGLRDAVMDLLDLECDPDLPGASIAPARAEAKRLYEQYTRTYGPLNRGEMRSGKVDPDTGQATLTWRRPPLGGFRRDPDYVAVMAIEQYDQETQESGPAPILLGRINARPAPITSVKTAGEALAVSMGEGRGVDFERIRDLLGLPDEASTIAALGDRIYSDPAAGGAWTLDRDYLSGNVRYKLRTALAAAARDAAYNRNVKALHAIQPEDLGPLDIKASLGAPWISPVDVRQFLADTFTYAPEVRHTPVVATWEIANKTAQLSSEVNIAWGTSRMAPLVLAEHALNGKTPVIYDEKFSDTGTKSRVKNNDETLAAEERLKALQERFAVWVWEDKDRSDRICAAYNERFNSHVARRNDGSYLTFPGMAEGVNLWTWQKDIVDRAVSSERFLCGHAVGAGKTKSMIASAVTLRRFKLANKPLIAVPNHLLEQIGREAQQTFPTARFLIASKEDLAADSRRLFAARCAMGDFDAVVMTHQALTSLGVDKQIEMDWLAEQQADLRWHLQQESSERSLGAKQIARALRSFEARIEDLRYETADEKQITFEQLGVDHLSVDEAHYFKRLPITTRAEGFSLGSSKRATDLLLKITSLATRHPGKPIVGFYTGTPWSNTLAETFVWQTYLQPERLEEAGVKMFDAWAANFVRYETRVEVTPDGSGFRLNRRPSVIQNYAELRGMLADIADLLPSSALDLARPESVVSNVVVKPSAEQKAFIKALAKRADRLRQGGKPERPDGKGIDNILVVCGDGRKAALDPYLVGIGGDSPKVAAIAERVAEIYHESKDLTYGASKNPGALQAVFSDLGTPHPGDPQTYGRLRAALIEHGVPAERIRWIHEAKTDKAKEALFESCRDGSVSVIMGSTEKMGVGTNIQHRLKALHHMDAPWRPSDLEQRDGRAIRPKNLNPSVDILRYLVEGSFDGFMWEHLSRKARFIAQIYRADTTLREVEDISEVVIDYAQVKALAAGNPKLLTIAALQGEVRRYRTLYAVHQQSVNAARRRADDATKGAARARNRARTLGDAKRAVDAAGTGPEALNMANMDGFAARLLEDRAYAVGYRGLTIRQDKQGFGYQEPNKGPEVDLLVDLGYNGNIGQLTLRKKALRNDGGKALSAPLDLFIDGLAERVGQETGRADRFDAEASEAHQAQLRAVFPEAEAMAEAERKLAEVEAEIAAEAAVERPAVADEDEEAMVREVIAA